MRSPFALLNSSIKMFGNNIKLLFPIFIIPAVLSIVIPFYFATAPEEVTMWDALTIAEFVVSLAVLGVANILMTIAITKAITAPETTTFGSAYRFAKQYFIPYLIVSILTSVIVVIGFVLLIIPGIIFMVWYTFAMYAVLFENKTGMEALRASKSYVKGKWMAIFGRLVFLFIAVMVVAIGSSFLVGADADSQENLLSLTVSQIVNFIVMPISIGYMYLLYLDAKSVSATSSSTSTGEVAPQA